MISGIYFKDRKSKIEYDDFYFKNNTITAPYDGCNIMYIQSFNFMQDVKYKQHLSKEEYYNDLVGGDSVQVSLTALLIPRIGKGSGKEYRVDNDLSLDSKAAMDVIALINKGVFEEIGIFFNNQEYSTEIVDISDFFREYMEFKRGEAVSEHLVEGDRQFGRIIDASCSASAEKGTYTLNLSASFRLRKGDE